MDNDLVLYTHPMSRGRIARWMLEETGAEYHAEILDYATAMKDAAYLAINPMGKVPALRHGHAMVTETAAICAYLADAFPAAHLAPPPGDAARGAYYRWLFFAAGPLEAAITNKALGFVVPDGRERMVGYGRFDDVMRVLEQALDGGEYIAGDSFTAADVSLGAQIGLGLRFGSIPKRDAFVRYWDRVGQRPAALRAAAIDDALLAEANAKAAAPA